MENLHICSHPNEVLLVNVSVCSTPSTHVNACKDQEIEQKFQDGMLTKMSKITDLISKLDGFAAGEDATRVKKC